MDNNETPYERGFYEGSRDLPVTLYAIQNDQNEYERGKRDGSEARKIFDDVKYTKRCDGCYYCSRYGCNRDHGGHCNQEPNIREIN